MDDKLTLAKNEKIENVSVRCIENGFNVNVSTEFEKPQKSQMGWDTKTFAFEFDEKEEMLLFVKDCIAKQVENDSAYQAYLKNKK
jgi:hypothetical protein